MFLILCLYPYIFCGATDLRRANSLEGSPYVWAAD